MSTPTLPAGWVGKPEIHMTPGALRVVRTVTLTTDWQSVAAVRQMANDADVADLVARIGLTPADVAANAILKRVIVQNLEITSDAQISDWAPVNTADPPSPAEAYETAQSSGGVVTFDYSTAMQMIDTQARMTDGSGTANVTIWFDVPRAL